MGALSALGSPTHSSGAMHPATPAPTQARSPGASPALIAVSLFLVLVPFLLRLPLTRTRGFNPDELEHSHFAWCLSQGQVPYRDYFEHHTPWLHLLLVPLYDRAEALGGDGAIERLFVARRLMLLPAAATLLLVFLLARRLFGPGPAWVATLLLSNTSIFLNKSLEIRPDVPAAALLVGGVWILARAFREEPWRAPAAFWGGLCLGAATMFTQKVLFVAPGLGAALVWNWLEGRRPARERARCLIAVAAGSALPLALTLAYFAWRGALWPFIHLNFLLNARWPGLGPKAFLVELALEDTFFTLFASIGLIQALAHSRRGGCAERVVVFSAISMAVALAYHPAVTFHYFLLVLPLAAPYAGAALLRAVEMLARVRLAFPQPSARAIATAAISLSLGLGAVGLAWIAASPRVNAAAVAPLLGALAVVVAVVGLGIPLWRGSAAGLAVASLLLLSCQPLLRLHRTFSRGNWATLQGIRYAMRNSAPWEPGLDGFTGLGVFRPHAFFYAFQNSHTLAIQTEEERRALFEDLATGRVAPKLVYWNHLLKEAVPPQVAAFVETHYAPAEIEPIRIRLFDNGAGWWSDGGRRRFGWARGVERAPNVLFDDQWRDPDTEDGVAVRRSRGRQPAFVVPVRQPVDFRATVRAKAAAAGLPFGVGLVVNGRPSLEVAASPRWQNYRFEIAASSLMPGFNRFVLRIGTPSSHTPLRRQVSLAVEYLELVAVSARGS